MVTKSQAKRIGKKTGKYVEALLSDVEPKRVAPKRKAAPLPKGGFPPRESRTKELPAYDERQKLPPFKGETVPQLIAAGLKSGAMTKDEAAYFRQVSAGQPAAKLAEMAKGMRADLEGLGLRFQK